MAPTVPPRLAYVPALDGLRGLAVASVLVYHADATWISGGYLGVSTFFTLSGFLITALLLTERRASGGIDLARFWGRRLRRLMPAALAGVALATAFVVVAGTSSQLWRMRWDGVASLLYFANFRFMASGHSYWEMFTRPSPLQHYWSLSIEEQFYLVYPLLLLGTASLARRGRDRTRAVLVALALLSTGLMVALALAGAAPSRLYYGTDNRAAEFLIGAVLATLLVRDGRVVGWRGRGWAAITLAAVAFVVAALVLVEEDADFLYRGGFALYALATAAIVNAAAQPGPVASLLSWSPLRLLGVVSYGVYIYHWPIYLWLDAGRTGLDGVALFALRVAVTLVVATASYVALERPIRERRWLHGLPARLSAPVAAAAAAALLVVVTTDVPEPRRPGRSQAARMPELGAPYPDGPLRVMVVGDSVAVNVGVGFGGLRKRDESRLTVWSFGSYGCGIGRGDGAVRAVDSADVCDDWPNRWEAAVERFRPDLVVVLTGVWDLRDRRLPGGTEKRAPGDPDFDAWLLREYELAVDVASSRGARVVWLTAPCSGPPPRKNPLRGTGALSPERVAHLNGVLLPALAASRPRQVQLFDLFSRVCPGGRFLEYDHRMRQIRDDYLHIARLPARDIAEWILAETFPEAIPAKKEPSGRTARVAG